MSTAIQICHHWIRPDLGLRAGMGRAVPAVCPWCEAEQLRTELAAIKRTREQEREYAEVCYENERLKHRCTALAYLHYGHYLVQRTRDSVQADIEACESALTALRAELRALPQPGEQT